MASARHRWTRESLRGAALEVVLAAACFLLAAVLIATLAQILALPRVLALLLAPLATALAAWVYGAASGALTGASLAPLPNAARQTWGQSALTGLLGFGAAMSGSVVIGLGQRAITGQEVQEQARIVALFERGDPLELSALGLAVVLLAPAAEEWLFRAQLYRRLGLWTTRPWALGLSAVLFAAVHGNLSGGLTYVWLALCFSFALDRSGRWGCAVFVHAANNAATFLLLFLKGQS